jgi:hypothetical protein
MRGTREFHSNCTPDALVKMMPLSCIFGAMREVFTGVEPLLREYGNWRRGVPFERLQFIDTPCAAAMERAGWSEELFPQEAANIRAELQRERVALRSAIDAVEREFNRQSARDPIAGDPTTWSTDEKVAHVLAMIFNHSELKAKDYAAAVGWTRENLYKYPKIKTALRARKLPDHPIRRGRRNDDTGNMDADD